MQGNSEVFETRDWLNTQVKDNRLPVTENSKESKVWNKVWDNFMVKR